jgi:hypothetical protein
LFFLRLVASFSGLSTFDWSIGLPDNLEVKPSVLLIAILQGRIHDFKLVDALKNIPPSGGRRANCWGILCEKSRFYAKKSFFFQF